MTASCIINLFETGRGAAARAKSFGPGLLSHRFAHNTSLYELKLRMAGPARKDVEGNPAQNGAKKDPKRALLEPPKIVTWIPLAALPAVPWPPSGRPLAAPGRPWPEVASKHSKPRGTSLKKSKKRRAIASGDLPDALWPPPSGQPTYI